MGFFSRNKTQETVDQVDKHQDDEKYVEGDDVQVEPGEIDDTDGMQHVEVSEDQKNDKPAVQKEDWLDDYEGQLTIDVYQTDDDIIVQSTIAGVKPENLDVTINGDMLTIKGEREKDKSISEEDYFYQECYWGAFSRSVILPMDVQPDKIKAELKDGILTVTLPKAQKDKTRKIQVSSE